MRDTEVILALLSPVVLAVMLFRGSMMDRRLLYVTLLSILTGAVCVIPLKFLIYPALEHFIGVSVRELIQTASSNTVRFFACVMFLAPLEEGCKFAGLLAVLLITGASDRMESIMLSAIFCGLGFSLVENLDYYSNFGFQTLLLRSVLSSGGHTVFSAITGLGLVLSIGKRYSGKHLTQAAGYIWLVTGFASASLVHGLFNVVAFSFSLYYSAVILVVFLVCSLIILRVCFMKVLVMDSGIRGHPVAWICSSCGLTGIGAGNYCTECGERAVRIGNEIA